MNVELVKLHESEDNKIVVCMGGSNSSCVVNVIYITVAVSLSYTLNTKDIKSGIVKVGEGTVSILMATQMPKLKRK